MLIRQTLTKLVRDWRGREKVCGGCLNLVFGLEMVVQWLWTTLVFSRDVDRPGLSERQYSHCPEAQAKKHDIS